MVSTLFKILEEYKFNLKELNQKLTKNFECVFNEDLLCLKDFSNIKAIVVMDNPGKEEREQKKYLVGTAGKSFNTILSLITLSRDEVLVFNKSSISTGATNDLNELYKKHKTIFLEEQELTANTIFKIRNILSVPLLIHGYSPYLKGNNTYVENEKSNRPLFVFFKLLHDLEGASNFSYFYKHSSYGNLSKQVSTYMMQENLVLLSFSQYLDLGIKNSKPFFN